MRTNPEYILRTIVDEKVLIPTGSASGKLNGMIHLTETAAFIWEQVDQSENLQEIVRKMTEEFDVSPETAQKDVAGFLAELYQREMVFDIPEFVDTDFSKIEDEES